MKTYKPTTPSRRFMTNVDFNVLTKKKSEKKLTIGKKKNVGRSHGKISVRHKGGGAKRKYRLVDFKRDKFDVPAKVLSIEYDPNRSSFIALVVYKDGEKRYILAPYNLRPGDEIVTSKDASTPIKEGNRLSLKNIPEGTFIYNIELEPGGGGKLVRSAGCFAKLIAKEKNYAILELPSTERRKIHINCMASVGNLSNPEHNLITIGKAGRSRLMRKRPAVRGSAMNPCDHPHGGGEGRAPIGLKHPKTPWGKPALGVRTRKRKKMSDKYIIRRRIKNK